MYGKYAKKRRSPLKTFVFFITLGLIPCSVSLLINIPLLFSSYSSLTSEMLWASVGFIIFIIVFFIFGAPVKSYVLEHELSHILFALLSAARIKDVSFKRNRAYVRTEKVNIFIVLAPYSFPLYTLLVISLYRILSIYFNHRVLTAIVYFIIGVSLAFHFIATIHYIQLDQPDMMRYGYFSSLILIFTWSLFVLAIVFALMFEDIRLFHYLRSSFVEAMDVYRKLFYFVKYLFSSS